MTTEQNRAFQLLLAAWCAHNDLHRGTASVPELVSSRARLDEARVLARRTLR